MCGVRGRDQRHSGDVSALRRTAGSGTGGRSGAVGSVHLPEGDLGTAELAKVESLKLDETEVADWGVVTTELKALPNLKMLGLRATGLTDAAPLAELTGLRYLYLEKNAISSAGPLCEMKSLKQLWLYGNPLPREEVILLEQALPRCEVFI